MGRAYDNTNRAARAAETAERIAEATEDLIRRRDLAQVTLADIAAESGVTVQTVLRHMGSREGCINAVAERLRGRVAAQRGPVAPGDLEAALDDLVAHYEAEGALVLKLLSQEGRDDFAAQAASEGRAFHRAWVVRCFGPRLRDGDEEQIDALVGATDLYLFKLYRHDLGRSKEATRAVIARLVRAVLGAT